VAFLILLFLFWADASYDQLLRDGLVALKANRMDEARASLERAVRAKPDGGEAWAALAQAYARLNFAVSGRNAAARAEAVSAKNPAVLRGLADYYTATHESGRAADFEERYALAIGARDPDALARAITLRIEAKQAKAAVALATKALAAGDNARLRGLLAAAYEADGQKARAINEYNRAILHDPYEESYYFQLSQLLIDQENFTTARQVLEAARKIFDKSPEIELALGTACYGLKKYDEAAFSFLKTVTLAPQAPQAYSFLGQVIDQSTRWLPEITTAFQSFAESQPRQYLPQFLYGKALLVGGKDLGEAEARLKKSISLQDGFWESHYQMGVLLQKRQMFPQALEELKKSATLAPRSALPHQQLARLYDQMGKPAEAKLERAAAEKAAAGDRPRTPVAVQSRKK
jgi:tetratricopeptide (TPR) repeat protein